ncbi:MAG TPA: anti-sigma factor [Acidobacteriaceae bacterium]|jgi:anti-sigma-K factor RskA|nr:anti-sigma factor [Acidobacteriaceae bacterium]
MTMREAFHIPEEDLIQYALGTLKEVQLSQFTAHISLCNDCRAELGRIQLDLAAFASVQPISALPAGARERFLNRLATGTAPDSKFVQIRNKSRLYLWSKTIQRQLESPMLLKVAAGVLAAATLFLGYDDLSHIHQIRQMGPAISRYERDAAEFEGLKDFLRGANTQQVNLRQTPVAAKAPEGHAIYSATTGKLVFTASNMAAPPSGKAYELWVLPVAGGKPIPAGVFTPDLQGNAAVVFPEIPVNVQAAGFGVTVEDAAGAQTPTPPIILSGQ